MAASNKFDLPSANPDRPVYNNGQRGSHLVAQLDRSEGFCENMKNPNPSSLPNMTRNNCVVAQGDVVNFFQCLRFDPKVVAAEHKCIQGDFRWHMNVALGISVDDSLTVSSKGKLPPEDVKRVKAILRESSVKARERVKIFNEALSVLNKFFPSIPSKKRSRSDGLSNDRSRALLSSDRSVHGLSLAKLGIQNPAITSTCEFELQKSEEQAKNAVPNKRTRTSLVDMRSNAAVRSSAALERDREMQRLAHTGAVQGDDRNLSIVVDSWDKAKMKKKRSGIKPDISPSGISTKPTDSYREAKLGMQQRSVTDVRSRLSSESHGFRPGVSNGTVGSGKSDGISQSTGLSMRSSIHRTDMDNSSLLSDRRERPIGSEKERVNFRAVNKANVREDFNSVSPTSSTKMNASIRVPQAGSSVTPKLSPVILRASNDWELSHCTNKPSALRANNRKRTASAQSSSPPVAHWAGQRPQKISRIARRTNLIPIVSNNDENSALDSVSDISGNEIGLGFARHLSGTSQQAKPKGDPLSSAALSESEEAGPPKIRFKEKGKKSDELDKKAGQNVQKVSTVGLPSRKNKLVTREDLGDGVQKNRRSGRGSASTRSLIPMAVEKLGNAGRAKQLRSARIGSDKNEGKSGQPPTRKLSDRKAYSRQKHSTVNVAADFLVGSDDGKGELLAAANAVINPAHALSSSFWRQMEHFFDFISDVDIAYLKQQRDVGGAAKTGGFELNPEQLLQGGRDISLCQRLLAAIVPEEDYACRIGDFELDAHGAGFESGSEGLSYPDNLQFSGHIAFNCYSVIQKPKHDEADTNVTSISNIEISSNINHSVNGVLSDQALMSSMIHPEFQYDSMQINEKLLLEVHSIGILPEPMPNMQIEDGGICGEISKLEKKYSGQVSKKKALLYKLMNSASEAKDLQEHEFKRCAYDKLIAMAYQNYTNCRSPSTAGGKCSSNKMAKLAALAFVKRVLEKCHKFEDTGKSCFGEPLFRDMFLSGVSQRSGARSVDSNGDCELVKLYSSASSHSLEGRVSESMGSKPSPQTSHLSQNGEHYINTSNVLHTGNHLPEQNYGKEDIWSNGVKNRDLLLDEVVSTGTAGAPPGIGGSLSRSTKGKRSEREREGKEYNREVLPRNGANKVGRPVSNAKGERKYKAKPKQKTAQLSVSINGLVGKTSEKPKSTLPSESKSSKMTTNSNAKDGLGMNVSDDPEAITLSNLPGIDGLEGQGNDLASWLNIDDDGLQDHDDFVGLEIPMDDLSGLNMMV